MHANTYVYSSLGRTENEQKPRQTDNILHKTTKKLRKTTH